MKADLGAGRDDSDMERLTAGIAYVVGACAIAMVSIVVWSIKSMFKAPDEPASVDISPTAAFDREDGDGEQEFATGLRRPGYQGGFLTPRGHRLTSFHTVLIVHFGGHLPSSPSF